MTRPAALLGVFAMAGVAVGCASGGQAALRPLGFTQYSASLVCSSWSEPDDSQPSRLTVFVSDELAAAMPGAKVSLRDGSGRSLLALIADQSGAVRIEEFASGRYVLVVKQVGFVTVQVADLELAPGCLTAVVIPMQLAEVRETIS